MDPFLLEPYLAAGLNTCRDLAADLAVKRGKHCLPAQNCRGIRNLRRRIEIQTFSGVLAVGIDMNLDQEITFLSIRSRHSASAQPDLLAILYAGWNLYFKCCQACFASGCRRILQLNPLCSSKCRVAETYRHRTCHIQRLLPGCPSAGSAAVGPAPIGSGSVTEVIKSESAET